MCPFFRCPSQSIGSFPWTCLDIPLRHLFSILDHFLSFRSTFFKDHIDGSCFIMVYSAMYGWGIWSIVSEKFGQEELGMTLEKDVTVLKSPWEII